MTLADIGTFLVSQTFLLFFFLPFAIIFVVMLAQLMLKSKGYAGTIPWNKTQREAYIAGVIGAIVTVAVTVNIGGPEVFVLYWRPLITTVITMPLAFAAAMGIFGLWYSTRK